MNSGRLYEVLGVDPGADPEELKRSFRAKVKGCHPDHHPGDAAAEAKFKEISAAYAVLSDPEKRRRYDATGDAELHPDNEASRAIELIIEIFRQIRQNEGENVFYTDPIERIRDVLEMSKARLYSEARKAGKQKQTARQLAEKLKFSGDRGRSFLHGVLENEQQHARRQISALRRELLLMRRAGKMLEDYSFDTALRKYPIGMMSDLDGTWVIR